MTNYSVDKQTLTLTSKDGGKMVFVAKDLEWLSKHQQQ
jgi:hypothetical protein